MAVVLQGNLLLTGDKDQLVMLLDQINTPFVRSNPSVLQGLLRIIPYLSFGELEKMRILVERFKPCCSFDKWASFSFALQIIPPVPGVVSVIIKSILGFTRNIIFLNDRMYFKADFAFQV